MKPIPVLLVTYNRLEYSKKALASIVDRPGAPLELTIWDNASTEAGFQEWLDSVSRSASIGLLPEVKLIIRSSENVGLAPAMNRFFRDNRDARYVAKVDNDTILPDYWLVDLLDVMASRFPGEKLGAVSGTCLRPYGMTSTEWYAQMPSQPFNDAMLYLNTYICGTGVLINMDMIRARGLLFEKFPRSKDSGPDDPCLISGWTAYCREASEYEGWRFLFYSAVRLHLQNIKEDLVLSNDYPEYDAEIAKARDDGNAWWDSVGGLSGVRKFVQDHGGLEQLYPVSAMVQERMRYVMSEMDKAAADAYLPIQRNLLTEAENVAERCTPEFWTKRIARHGTTHSTFLSTPQARINEFTDIHMRLLSEKITGRKVLDVGCGWGRVSRTLAQMAGSYTGVDFMPALIDKAKESLPELDFRVVDVRHLPFGDGEFDVVIAITCLSSFAGDFENILAELQRVSKGEVIFLEERFARVDWKLRSE